MDATLITAIISFAGTVIGTLGGILITNRLTNYRLEQLEKKVDKHNNLIERTYKLEEALAVDEEKIKAANQKIDDLENNLRRFIPNHEKRT